MNVCIVEDNSDLLESFSLLLQEASDIHVSGACRSAEDALRTIDWPIIDILLADIDLPGMSGVELIAQVKGQHPNVEALAYTIFEDRDVVMAAIRAGASGYLLKGSNPHVLIRSIHEVYEGGAPMTPKIARKLIAEFQLHCAPPAVPETPNDLSAREIAILRFVEKGLSYVEIGDQLGISPHTVHTHIKNIYGKIHARSRSEMLRKARRLGVL